MAVTLHWFLRPAATGAPNLNLGGAIGADGHHSSGTVRDDDPAHHRVEHSAVAGARIVPRPVRPRIYLGRSSDPATEVAARHVDVSMTWDEPPDQVTEKLERVRRPGRHP